MLGPVQTLSSNVSHRQAEQTICESSRAEIDDPLYIDMGSE